MSPSWHDRCLNCHLLMEFGTLSISLMHAPEVSASEPWKTRQRVRWQIEWEVLTLPRISGSFVTVCMLCLIHLPSERNFSQNHIDKHCFREVTWALFLSAFSPNQCSDAEGSWAPTWLLSLPLLFPLHWVGWWGVFCEDFDLFYITVALVSAGIELFFS